MTASSEIPARRAGTGRSGSGGRVVLRAGAWFGGLTTQMFFPAGRDSSLAPADLRRFFRKSVREPEPIPPRSGPPRWRQRLPAAERRSQLLAVALDQFAARGFHETSMDDIAEAAGVTKPVLYQHFPSKRTLYRELLETEGLLLLGEVTRMAAAEDAPYRRLLGGFRAYFQFVCERTPAFQLVFGSGARLTDEFAETVRVLEGSVAAAIGGFIDADIDEEHRTLLGYAIVGLAEVVGRQWVSRGGDGLDPAEGEELAVRLADLLWAGLRALPSRSR